MTAYKHHIPGVTTGLKINATTAALEAKERRKAQLEAIRRRRAERYKRFLARKNPQST